MEWIENHWMLLVLVGAFGGLLFAILDSENHTEKTFSLLAAQMMTMRNELHSHSEYVPMVKLYCRKCKKEKIFKTELPVGGAGGAGSIPLEKIKFEPSPI